MPSGIKQKNDTVPLLHYLDITVPMFIILSRHCCLLQCFQVPLCSNGQAYGFYLLLYLQYLAFCAGYFLEFIVVHSAAFCIDIQGKLYYLHESDH